MNKKNKKYLKPLLMSLFIFSNGLVYAYGDDIEVTQNSETIQQLQKREAREERDKQKAIKKAEYAEESQRKKEKSKIESAKVYANSKEDAIRYYESDNQEYKDASFNYFLNNAGREPSSLYYMGLITYNGEFTIAKDEITGLKMIEVAAKSGYKDASLFIAKINIESNSDEYKQKGLQLLLDPKFQADGNVLFYLGKLYEDGVFIPKNAYYSERYYTEAANAGNEEASYKIGSMYIKSDNEQKQKEGWVMIAKSANRRNADACHLLAAKLRDSAINQNAGFNSYLTNLKCSANGGNALDAKEYAYYLVTGKFVKYNNKEAYKYYQIYLDNNKDEVSPNTYFEIGVLSVETNNKKSAKDNLSKASANGVANASYYVAKLSENGYWNGEPDFINAKEYYERAKEQGRTNVDIDLKRVHDKINLIIINK